MTGEQKQSIEFIMQTLKIMLKETNVYIGVVTTKSDKSDPKIAFIDRNDFAKGDDTHLEISLEELNK